MSLLASPSGQIVGHPGVQQQIREGGLGISLPPLLIRLGEVCSYFVLQLYVWGEVFGPLV